MSGPATTSPVPGPTLHDLTDASNLDDALYELRRALDRGDTQLLANWAREWGEAALVAIAELLDAGGGDGEPQGDLL